MKAIYSLFFSLTCCLGIYAQQSSFSQFADQVVAAKMEEFETPGLAIGVVKEGKVIHAKGYGVANVNTGIPVTAQSIFHTASVSKLFTALAIMELVIEGKLNLDDKLTDILPKLNYKDQDVELITLRQMLDHSSGIPDIFNYDWPSAKKEEDALRNYIENKRFRTLSPPGTKYKYSNLAYDALGMVAEEASDMSFEDYIKQKWLTPSGMIHSDFRYYLTDEKLRTTPHTKKGAKVMVRDVYPYNREHGPSSTLNSTAMELSLFMIRFMKMLEASEHKTVYQSMIQPASDLNTYAGLGFQLGEQEGWKKVGHHGSDKGYRSYLFMIPEKEMGFVLLANCDFGENIRQEVLNALAEKLLDE